MPIEVGVSLLLTFMTTEVGVSLLVTHMGASLPFADSHHHQIGRLPVAHFVSTKVGVSLLRTPVGVFLLLTLVTADLDSPCCRLLWDSPFC